MSYVFISGPYSHPEPQVVNNRVGEQERYAVHLLNKGVYAVSTVLLGHPLVQQYDLPNSFEFWKDYCFALLSKASELHILQLPEWDSSPGVKAEINLATDLSLDIKYIDPYNYDY